MSDKLLPCPFCGHGAELDALEGSIYWRGMCQSSFKCGNGPWQQSKRQAIAAWNRRSSPRLEAVKDLVKKIEAGCYELTCEEIEDLSVKALAALDREEKP